MNEIRALKIQRIENALMENEFSVDLTIHNIPISLLEDFSGHVMAPVYQSEVAESIRDLMRKAILKQKLATNK